MRHDRETLGDALVDSPQWENRNPRFRQLRYTIENDEGKTVGRAHAFSAHERNSFFVNGGSGKHFTGLAPLSGADSAADSRALALLDFDRDGDIDLALVNSNNPSFNLYRTNVPRPGNFIVVRLRGGARLGETADPPYSNRDGIGARIILVTPSGLSLTRLLNAGEGYGAQNSKTVIIGLGKDTEAGSLTVRWPSGRQQRQSTPIASGSLVEFDERADAPVEPKTYVNSRISRPVGRKPLKK